MQSTRKLLSGLHTEIGTLWQVRGQLDRALLLLLLLLQLLLVLVLVLVLVLLLLLLQL